MQNKLSRNTELLTKEQLATFTNGPIKMFTRNTEHWLTTRNIFDHATVLALITYQWNLDIKFFPSVKKADVIFSRDKSIDTAMKILINSVKNN